MKCSNRVKSYMFRLLWIFLYIIYFFKIWSKTSRNKVEIMGGLVMKLKARGGGFPAKATQIWNVWVQWSLLPFRWIIRQHGNFSHQCCWLVYRVSQNRYDFAM